MAAQLNLPPHINGDTVDKYIFKISSGTEDDKSPINFIGAEVEITIRARNRNGQVIKKWTQDNPEIFENKKKGEIKIPTEVLEGPIGKLYYSIWYKDDNITKTLVEGEWSIVNRI